MRSCDRRDDEQAADDCHGILDEGCRRILAEGGGQPGTDFGAAERTDDRADGAKANHRDAGGRANHRAGEGAGNDASAELLRLNPDITDTRPLPRGRAVLVFRGIRPAQLALLSPEVADTLILTEVK